MFKRFFTRTWALYLALFLAVLLLCDFKRVDFRRMNWLTDYADYPAQFVAGKTGWQKSSARISLRYYRQLSAAYPQLFRGEEMAGMCLVLLSEDRKAAAMFSRALRKKPDAFWVAFEKGRAFYRMGRWQEAQDLFRGVLEIPPEDMIRAAFLSGLTKMPAGESQKMAAMLPAFVAEVRQYAGIMALLSAGRIQDPGAEVFRTDNPAEAFAQKRQPLLHPWSYVISPGKEMLLN